MKTDFWKTTGTPVIDDLEFKKINSDECRMLTDVFTEEEVKNAVWSYEGWKSPGPDGFNFKFIKKFWDVIKGDILKFIDDFQKHGKIVKGGNPTFIVLIPKKENPQELNDYRPISLIGCMYKLLSKLLAERLKKVLDKIISVEQTTFVGGRS